MLHESFDLATLRAVNLFAPLSDQDLEKLRPVLAVETLNVGDVVLNEGDAGTKLYVLLVGEVKVVRKHRQPDEKVIAKLTPIETFGAMSLIAGESRSATVVCTDTCRFLAMDREGLEQVLLHNPSITLLLLQDAYRHLRETLDKLDGGASVR